MRSDEEILARARAMTARDLLGTQQGDLLCRLPFPAVRAFFKNDAPAAEWKIQPRDDDAIKERMHKYMKFAWGKANNRRGLSAGRSMDHMSAWLWLLGHDEAADAVLAYDMYGKGWLRAICEAFGWDWRQWDDGVWTSDEEAPGTQPPETVAPLPLGPRS